jgi:hypothetical protein
VAIRKLISIQLPGLLPAADFGLAVRNDGNAGSK